jgi:HSP20 family molecular chaperone IbpA
MSTWWTKGLAPAIAREVGERSRAFYELLTPAVDIYEIGSSLVVEADLAGFQKEDITVRASGHTLLISAKREPPSDVDSVHVQQRPLKIRRVVRLPLEVDEEVEPTAKYENGVLTVKMPSKGAKRVKIE